jgi:hypothetical protein
MAASDARDCGFNRAWSGQLPNRRAAQVVIVDLAAVSAVNCTSAMRASSNWSVAARCSEFRNVY